MTTEYQGMYSSMVVSEGGEILQEWNIGHYEGDEIYLLKKEDKYALVVIGYGSCSGCDAYYACKTDEEKEELRKSVVKDIKWMTKPDLMSDISGDKNNRWYYHDSDWNEVRAEIWDIIS